MEVPFQRDTEFPFTMGITLGACQVRPERPIHTILLGGGQRKLEHVDIWIKRCQHQYLFELKYRTENCQASVLDEVYWLTSQDARDQGRYDYLKDVQRLESLVGQVPNSKGLAIFLTNDPGYWKDSKRDACDRAFRIDHGRKLGGNGPLGWAPGTSRGVMKGRTDEIRLTDAYRADWSDYSEVAKQDSGRYKRFKYLVLEITPPCQE